MGGAPPCAPGGPVPPGGSWRGRPGNAEVPVMPDQFAGQHGGEGRHEGQNPRASARGARQATLGDLTRNGTAGTVGTMSSSPKAMNLRFPDPEQRAAIEAAARKEGVSLQEYILSAAYA